MAYPVVLPFSGFYSSIHESECETELERLFDYEGSGNVNSDIVDAARDAIDWSIVYEKYAQEYASGLGYEYMLEIEYDGMSSPKYYNFETDRVFGKISRDSLKTMLGKISRNDIRKRIREKFTSRSGFISHYSNDMSDWPSSFSEWDHNQIGVILELYIEHESLGGEFDSYCEYQCMESAFGNGFLHDVFFDSERSGYDGTLNRLDKICRYLDARKNRPIKTLEQWHAARRAENRAFTETALGQWGV